ncbi:unnamed protein product [Calypogeia fissa]
MKEVYVSNIPYTATEEDLKTFLESVTSPGAVCFCELRRDSFQTSHKGYGFVTFSGEEVAEQVRFLATSPYHLRLQGRSLRINVSKRQVKHNPEHSVMRLEGSTLSMGCLTGDTLNILWSTTSSKIVDCEFDFRERKLGLKVGVDGQLEYGGTFYPKTTFYKLEFRFGYIYSICHAKRARASSKGPMLLLEVWFSPHLFKEDRGGDLSELLFV